MRRFSIGLIGLYRSWVSPWLPPACRFEPTCSHYAQDAIRRHGLARGFALALWRLLKCHPFHPGGYDPVK
ncbi:MAG: membrane protein insertion efficiency factor YidD [Nitrospirota bacterium]|nr:membrane protein insertion efficiency factor YidD [Nitrospirota bacterium]MDE3034328.1 membrane protein insertion efficiency factor YidD [Nitrospirota bacterium]MDE3118041.1 membrane protein insertion efficiency factor YidD [Nitrospirota bacterium]MDE3226514.1 membrane protein insertion efficiency factor YidD [Nitrospirota bacterium]MDE3243163.1 membrane protein insertion efficiency factor YidD [Nitrospirota bacterium]